MRMSPVALVLISALSIPVYAASFDDKIPDQCFLYAQLVHEMIEFSANKYASGDVEKATSLLKRAQEFTHKLHVALAGNDKKLKDAQILLRHTAFRLSEMLHASSFEDRPLVQNTLAQVNQAQNEAMLQVFRK